jgi:hypothetical protein
MNRFNLTGVHLLFVLFIMLGCNRDKDLNYSSYVNFQVNLNEARYIELQTYNNAMIVRDDVYGTNQTAFGVILYRGPSGEFWAFDRLCLYHDDNSCAVDLTSDVSIAECPCCETRYILSSEGDPISGPSKTPLLQYNTSLSGQILYVRGEY